MDILLFIFIFLVCIEFIVYLSDAIENKKHISIRSVVCRIVFLTFLIGYFTFAIMTKPQTVTEYELQTMTDNNSTTQIIMDDSIPINITSKLGKVFVDGTRIKRTTTYGVWSKGIFFVFGSDTFTPIIPPLEGEPQ